MCLGADARFRGLARLSWLRCGTDPLVLEREVRNYQALERILKAVPGRFSSFRGSLDGRDKGIGTTEQVPPAGQNTVTAACVVARSAGIFIRQENPQGHTLAQGLTPAELSKVVWTNETGNFSGCEVNAQNR